MGVRLVIRSAGLRCCVRTRLALLLAAAAFIPGALPGQLTTGIVEGSFRAPDGNPLSGSPILVTGGAGFQATIHTNSEGEFTLTLPYGRYQISGVTVFVGPLQITRLDLATARLAA